jgi:SET domain-containing protein
MKSIKDSLSSHILKLGISNIDKAGIGVFAVTDIVKDTVLFEGGEDSFIEWKYITEESKPYISSITHNDDKGIYLNKPINEIYIAYYFNHSELPNVHYDSKNDRFIAIRDIKKEEELTCYYIPEERDWNVPKS